MFRAHFFLFSLLWSLQTFAAAPLTDILFDRSATFEDRQSVATVLSLGPDKPLKASDAIAELCYGIDLCAGATDETEVPVYCRTSKWPFENDTVGVPCYPDYFKKHYSCNSKIPKQTYATVDLAGKLIADLQTMYTSYVYDVLVSKIDPQSKMAETIAEEALALGAYTLDCYEHLNSILYRKDQDKIHRYYNLFKAVINTLTFFPEHKGMVNRGVNLPTAVLKEHHKVGNIVCYDGFTSSSIHDPETDRTSNPRNEFLKPKCEQRLYISYDERSLGGRSISKGSALRNENEVLFSPGACFRIDKVYPRTDEVHPDEVDIKCEEGTHYNFEMTLI